MTSSATGTFNGEGSPQSSQFVRKLMVNAGAFLSLAIVCLALWALYHTLQKIELRDVLTSFRELPGRSIFLAFCATAASYLVVTVYDVVALHHIGRQLPYWRAALAAFLASAFGNNIGFSVVTGASVRYRMYSPVGLSAFEIAGVSTMCTLTTTLGMVVILALSMVLSTGEVADAVIQVPAGLRHVLGVFILVVMGAYLVVTALRPITLQTQNWSLRLPSAKTTLSQIVLGGVDMLLVGSIVYLLLQAPVATSYMGFLGVFVLATMAGGVSHVPGGIGVFETVLLLGLPEVSPAALLVSAVLFRCIYFLTPLSLAAILFATHEALLRRARIVRIHGVATDWLTEIGPQVMGVIIIFAGVVLLFSGSIPATRDQHVLLQCYLPLWVVELSHITASATGLGLVILARGLSRRLATAHHATAVLLAIGIAASYLKGMDYDEAMTLAIILTVLLPTRREFHRRGSLFSQGFTVEWVSTLTAILAVTVWFGLFNYKHIEYTPELWWTFSFDGDYSQFLRSTLVVFVLTGGATLANLLWPDAEPEVPDAAEINRVRQIIRRNDSETRGTLALLGDKRLLFSDSGNAFIMYQVQGKSWVALGDPVGPSNERARLLWRFRELCDRYGGRPVFYLIGAEALSLYVDLGLSLVKLGDEARVGLGDFSLLSDSSSEVRAVHQDIRARCVRFEMVMSGRVPGLLPELKAVSDAWLAHTSSRERGFSTGFFDPGYVARLPCAVARKDDRIIAFAILWASRNKEELALDLIRYHPDAPPGVMDFLLLELMLGGKARGYRWFNLGIAPLASVETHPLAPLWHRIGTVIYRQSEHFRDIESLRRWEEHFQPSWRPKYLASPGGLNVPRTLRDIGRLIARGRK